MKVGVNKVGDVIFAKWLNSIPHSLRQSVLYALALFFSKGIGFLMIPVFTHYLEPADYGRLDVLQTLADLLSIVLIMGLSDALFKFYGEAQDEQAKSKVAANIFGIALFLCVVSTVLLQCFAPILSTLLPGEVTLLQTRFILLSLSVSSCLLIPLCWYRMKDDAVSYFRAATGRVVMQAGLSIYFLYAGFGVTGVMAAGAVASLFWAVKTSIDFLRDHGAEFDLKYWKKFLIYGSPLILTGLAGFVLGSFDRWILAGIVGPAVMAKYALAAKFGLLTVLLVQPFDLWWQPKRFEVLNQTDGACVCAKTISIGLVITALSIICITAGAPLVITLMTPATYHDSIQYVPFLSALAGLHGATMLVNIGIYNVKVTKWPAIIDMSAAAIAFAGYMVFIPHFAAWGAIGATTIALSLRFVATFMLSQRIAPLPYDLKALSGLLMLIIITIWIFAYGFDLVTHIAVGLVWFCVVILYSISTALIPSPMEFIKARVIKCRS